MKNNQTNRHKTPLRRLLALALTLAMALSVSNVSVFAADVLGDSSAASSADSGLTVNVADASSDPADESTGEDEQQDEADQADEPSADESAADSSAADTESDGAEEAAAGEEENATEDTGDPADESEAEGDESAEAEAEDEAAVAVTAQAGPGQDQGSSSTYSGHIDVRITGGSFEYTTTASETTTQSITVTKTWDDSVQTADHSNDSVSVYLVDEDGEKATNTVTLNAANSWSYTFTGLSLDAGEYTAVEEAVNGYDSTSGSIEVEAAGSSTTTETVKGTLTLTGINSTLTYTHGGNTYSVTYSRTSTDTKDGVSVTEYDFTDSSIALDDGDKITVTVSYKISYTITAADGTVLKTVTDEEYTDKTYVETVSSANNLCSANGYDFEVSPEELMADEEIVYEYTVGVTNSQQTVDITASKEWEDYDYADYYCPESVVVALYADGEATGKTATLTAADGWEYTFTNLPKYDYSNGVPTGDPIEYTVEETLVDSYTSEITGDASTGYTITNTLQTGSVTITKTVTGAEIDAEEYTFTLTNNTHSEISFTGTVTGSGTLTFTDVPVGTYTLVEKTSASDLNDYTTTMTNNGTVEVTEGSTATVTVDNKIKANASVGLYITKVLNGADLIGGEFSFTLTPVDGAPMPNDDESITATNDANGKVYFGDVDFDEDDIGQTYTYTVTEDTSSKLNGVTYGSGAQGTSVTITVKVTYANGEMTTSVTHPTIANTFSQGKADISGTKDWDDGDVDVTHDNASDITLVVEQSADNGETWTTLTSGYTVSWSDDTYTIKDLPQYGEYAGTATIEYQYRVSEALYENNEITVGDYTYVGDGAYGSFTNTLQDEDPVDPTKSASTSANVAVGNTITYTITYYNNLTTNATVVITDVLDDGVDFVSATEGGKYDETTHTVTWTIENAAAFEEGSVELTVKVNSDAKTIETGETTASVKNTATVKVGNQSEQTTGTVTNDLEDDDPTSDKTVNVGEGTQVEVGETLVYTITYYNNTNTVADVTITDVLDAGLTYGSSTGSYDEDTRTVTWLIEGVDPFTEGKVTLTVTVNENAKTIGTDETTATVVNSATVKVGNDSENESTAGPVENKLKDDPTTDPEKTVTSDTGAKGANVKVNDQITYTITYTNNTNSVADVTITDVLDAGLTFVDASDGGTESNGTVTWTISKVAPFTSGSVTVTVVVNSDAVTEGTVKNTASVAIGDTAAVKTEPVENPVDDDPQDPVKTSNVETDDSVAVGDEITYTISYYNHLGTAATVVVTDELAEGLTYVSSNPEGAVTGEQTAEDSTGATYSYGGTVTWTIENVAAHTSGEVTVTVKVNEKAKGETVSNKASVQIGDNQAVDTAPVDVPVDEDPVDPTKSADVGEADVKVGDTLTYTISYYNNLGVAADVVITDVLDTGVDYVSGGDSYDEETRTVTWTISKVAPFTSGSVTLTVTVNESARTQDDGEDAASVQNTASVSIDNAAAVDTNTVNNDIEDDDPVAPVKSVDLDADGVDDDGANVAVGDVLTYSITYYNHHNTTATVTITDELDAGVSFVSASDDGVYDADTNTVTWTLTDVAAFTGGSVTLQVQVTDDAKTIEAGETQATVENTATVAVTCGEDVVTETSNTVVNPVDDEEPVEPQKFVSASSAAGVSGANVSVGDEITYIISYYNNTNTVATVTITDPLDAGLDFVEASDGGTYSEDDNTVTWVIEDVAPYSGATVSLTVVVNEEALTAGEVDNSAHVTIGDNAYTTNVTINHVDDDPQDPTKEIDVGEDAELTAGEQYTYTITYYNHLGTAATVTITDELDDNLTFVSASDGGEEVDGVVTWVIEDVDPYATGSVTLTVEVNDDATGTITNTAIVQIADGDPTDTSTTTITEDTNTVENTIAEEESETTTSSSSSSKSSTPKTGDTFRLTLWVLLLAGSAAGLLVLYFRRKSSDDAE